MSGSEKHTGPWMKAETLSKLPRVQREFDLNRDPYIRAQLRDAEKTEAQRRTEQAGRGSTMVKTDSTAPVFRPPESISKPVDRKDFQGRWMAEIRDAVFARASATPRTPEQEVHQTPSYGRHNPEKEEAMNDFVQVNENEYIHLTGIKRMRVVTEKERASLAKLGAHVDASRFNTRLDQAGGSKSYAPETIDQIAAQGVALVEIDDGTFVPAKSIGKVRSITEQDRAGFQERTGRAMREDFQSRVETRAGMVLSTLDSQTIMERISRPYQPKGPESEQAEGMAQDRDMVMAQAAPVSKGPSNAPQREPEI